MRPLFHQFANHYKARAVRIVAEDDVVVVEARGEATTKSGKPYNQTYCYVFQLTDGKVRELIEYLDTDLVNQVLETPAAASFAPVSGPPEVQRSEPRATSC